MFVCQLHHILDAFLVDGRITNLEFGDIGSRIALFSLVFRFLVGKQGSQMIIAKITPTTPSG